MASARPSRPLVSRTRTAATATVAALALAGCSATNPIATQQVHNVTDGLQVVLTDDVAALNLLVLAGGEGEPGTLVGALSNKGRDAAEVTIATEGGSPVTVDVPARGTVLLGGEDGEAVEIDEVAAGPGALLPVDVSTDLGGTMALQVPVLDSTLPEYADLVPDVDA